MPEPKTGKIQLRSYFPLLGHLMFDTATTALLRAVFEDVNAH